MFTGGHHISLGRTPGPGEPGEKRQSRLTRLCRDLSSPLPVGLTPAALIKPNSLSSQYGFCEGWDERDRSRQKQTWGEAFGDGYIDAIEQESGVCLARGVDGKPREHSLASCTGKAVNNAKEATFFPTRNLATPQNKFPFDKHSFHCPYHCFQTSLDSPFFLVAR